MANDCTGKKRGGLWSLIKAVLIIAAIVFVAYKIYDKYFRKKVKQDVLADDDVAEPMISAENN